MTATPEHGQAARRRVGLAPLLGAIVTARRDEKERQRGRGVTAFELVAFRANTLHALEDYAAALEAMAWPVPRNLQTQIRMHRALLSLPHTPAGTTASPGTRDG